MKAFYQKMGFEGVRFKPAFYPYTEPSVDVMVYMESRTKCIERGGSGSFRPEVTEPLGCLIAVGAAAGFWGALHVALTGSHLGAVSARLLKPGVLWLAAGAAAASWAYKYATWS